MIGKMAETRILIICSLDLSTFDVFVVSAKVVFEDICGFYLRITVDDPTRSEYPKLLFRLSKAKEMAKNKLQILQVKLLSYKFLKFCLHQFLLRDRKELLFITL